MDYKRNANDLQWQPHPSGAAGIEMKKLRGSADGAAESIAIVRIAPGAVVAPHVHPDSDDNLYILSGHWTMRVLEQTFPIGPGDQITVPIDTEHEIYDVSEELLIYDVFAPPAW
jgi:mannose-6-phosphate isomerase-like protein (cupin superfamily)